MSRRGRQVAAMMMFENRSEPLLPWERFVRRMLGSAILGGVMVIVCLAIGIVGYHVLGKLEWIDSLVNASMILGGMGPVDPIHTTSGKLFESGYALFSGVAFITSVGVFLAPALHRLLHKLHLESEADNN
jgi:multisubunit Na+/H+ antiporter MnhB subunit